MHGSKYLISYDWQAPRGTYTYMKHWEGDSLIMFLIKFAVLSFKYEIIDVQYRNFKDCR